MKTTRIVKEVHEPQMVMEGAGVLLRRSFGPHVSNLHDPFLLFDNFAFNNPVEGTPPGFPTHPHRGIETVTYMIEGSVRHRDSIGNVLFVAIGVSLVCSVLVASAAVILKPRQLLNEEEFRQRIILDVAGLYEPDADIGELFEQIETRGVDLDAGEYVGDVAYWTADNLTIFERILGMLNVVPNQIEIEARFVARLLVVLAGAHAGQLTSDASGCRQQEVTATAGRVADP